VKATLRTKLESPAGIAAMVQHVGSDLVPSIDQLVQNNFGHRALSERLAPKGVLPMFGFPNRARYLFHGGPPRAAAVVTQLAAPEIATLVRRRAP